MVPDEANLYLGQTLSKRYQVQDFLAAGGFCFVFMARDLLAGQDVALKILSLSASTDQQIEFESEGQMLDKLRKSSNVVDLIDSNNDVILVQALQTRVQIPIQVRYLALELADACLTELIVKRQQLPWKERLFLLRGVVKGIHQMHILQMVHRDIKSENVLLFEEPKTVVTTKVTDLGRGRDLQAPRRFQLEAYEIGRGDLRFAPPELLWFQGSDGSLGWLCADIYLLGSVLFELATGQGITALTFGDSRNVLTVAQRIPRAVREREFRARISEMRRRYELAYSVFEQSVPPAIKSPASSLLRQLTDPDPLRRLPRPRPSLRLPTTWDLQWLLRRIDILLLTLRKAEIQAARLRRRKEDPS
jgi:serine/threonine protein kinase